MRYSIVHHDVRERFNITLGQYLVCDSIHQLSKGGECTSPDTNIASFLGMNRQYVWDCKSSLEKIGLIKRTKGGFTTTDLWYQAVTFVGKNDKVSEKTTKSVGKNDAIKNNKERITSALEDEPRIVIEKEPRRLTTFVEEGEIPTSPRVSGDKRKAYDELIAWSEHERGFKFLKSARTKQYAAFKIANENGITRQQLIERWEEMAQDKFWKEKGFDWMNVVSSFNRKQV